MGIDRASEYGFTTRGPVQFYLELMLAFGSDFDRDPQFSWMRAALTEEGDQTQRAQDLYAAVNRYLDEVNGPRAEHSIAALQQVRSVTVESLSQVGSDLEAQAGLWLRSFHPRRCDFAGENALRQLLPLAREASHKYRLAEPEGSALLLGLMFMFGAGVCTDPMFPWLRRTLEPPPGQAAQSNLARLLRRGQTYVEQMLSQLQP